MTRTSPADGNAARAAGAGGSARYRLRKLLLVPDLIRTAARAPRDGGQWDRFWTSVSSTGPGGDVLWDAADSEEIGWCVRKATEHLDPTLPIVDLGCGNGRYTCALAEHFAAAVGVDVAVGAVQRAQMEAGPNPRVSFRVLDGMDPTQAAALAREVAPANVFVRGLLHVVDDDARTCLIRTMSALTGGRGSVLLVETAFTGSVLDYLAFLAGGRARLPDLVRLLIRTGVPAPRRFGLEELDRHFPLEAWKRLETGPVEVHTLDPQGRASSLRIPGFFAALEPARRIASRSSRPPGWDAHV